MKKTLIAISVFLLGIFSVSALSLIQESGAMATGYAAAVSEVCYYNAETNEPIEGLDDKDYYFAIPRSTTDIGNESWLFTSIRAIGEGCYQFIFKGEGSVFLLTSNLPEGYKGPTGFQTIYSSTSTPYPAAGFKIEVTEVEDTETRSGGYSGTFDEGYDFSDAIAEARNAQYGQDIQEYAELAQIYAELASDYKDDACDEADQAEAARQEGDYEAFETHMENSQNAADMAQAAADQATAYAETARDLANAAAAGNTSSNGIEIEIGTWTDVSSIL